MAIFTVTSSVEGNNKPTVGNYSIFLPNRQNKVLSGDMFTTNTNPPYSDPDGDLPVTIKILSLVSIGTLQFNGVAVTIGQEISLADINAGNLIWNAPDQDTIASVSFQFTVSDGQDYADVPGRFSIINSSLTVYINKPAVVGNKNLDLIYGQNHTFTLGNFTTETIQPYYDPEGDAPLLLKIISLPVTGTLLLSGNAVTVDQVIPVADIPQLTYVQDMSDIDGYTSSFIFQIQDSGSGQYSNDGVFTVVVEERLAVPPVVDDNNTEYVGGQYQFVTGDFTNNFTDGDGDSYENVIIKTLPPIGDIEYNGAPVTEDFEFNINDIGNLKYNFPNNYLLKADGYCRFDEPINDIISTQSSQGFELVSNQDGKLEFRKEINTSIPNDTDIYAFFDGTSMKIADAQAASTALNTWFADLKANNALFTGNLYILPVVYEKWVDFPNIVLRGSSVHVHNNPDRPADDFMSLAIVPPNFDLASNDPNPNWTVPTKVVTLAFIDEVDQGSSIPAGNGPYHRDRNGYGFSQQPSEGYLTDYKKFVDNYSQFDFFKGVFYPIPNITAGSYNNTYNACVLQGFAAIEGGARYTLAEIEALGVTYAEERRFHWHLDPNLSTYTGTDPNVANPYSAEAQTPVPGANYNLQGLKNFGWIGVYDKKQPAASVFTSTSFATELNSFFQGEETSSVQTKVIQGECEIASSICFDFQTSDDSTFKLYSNTATFCLALSSNNTPPVVDDNSAPLRIKEYVFTQGSFIKNFQDTQGDSYRNVTIKSLPALGKLQALGQDISVDYKFAVSNSSSLVYVLDDRYAVYNGAIFEFSNSLDSIVSYYASLGYILSTNVNGTLTFVKANSGQIVIHGTPISTSINFNFVTSDDNQFELNSNIATFTLLPEGNINIKVGNTNQPPSVGDRLVHLDEGVDLVLYRQEFVDLTDPRFSDPEGDQPYKLRIDSLLFYGQLQLRGVPVQVDDELFFDTDIDTGDFVLVSPVVGSSISMLEFDFSVSDTGSKQFA